MRTSVPFFYLDNFVFNKNRQQSHSCDVLGINLTIDRKGPTQIGTRTAGTLTLKMDIKSLNTSHTKEFKSMKALNSHISETFKAVKAELLTK